MIKIEIDQASVNAIGKKLKLKKGQTEEKVKAGIKAGLLLITNEGEEAIKEIISSLKQIL